MGRHTGVIVGSYLLNERVRYRHFPKKIKNYLMINFGGALLFGIDEVCSEVPGVPAGTLAFVNAQPGTTFNQVIHASGGEGHVFFTSSKSPG